MNFYEQLDQILSDFRSERAWGELTVQFKDGFPTFLRRSTSQILEAGNKQIASRKNHRCISNDIEVGHEQRKFSEG